jgi:hypothetical protein
MTTPFKRLLKAGVALPPVEEMDDAALSAKLQEVVRALAEMTTYLDSTDHLSDRELYVWLWKEGLREGGPILPPGWNNVIDVLGSGSEEDVQLRHRFYADDEERERWMKNFPDYKMPQRQKPPYDRDRHLPKPDFGH